MILRSNFSEGALLHLWRSVPIVFFFFLACASSVQGQESFPSSSLPKQQPATLAAGSPGEESIAERIPSQIDPTQGLSATALVARALASNPELAAARLDIERARARLLQAGLRPNPILDFEQSSGRLANNPGDRATSVGVALPLEVSGQRGKRIDLAQAELAVAEAEIAERERLLAAEVHKAFIDTLSAQRELDITNGLNRLDTQTIRVVEVRVSEGDAAPLEASLLRVELDRLLARRALVEGKLQAALLRLKMLAGIAPEEPLQLRADFPAVLTSASLNEAVETALRTRPDLRKARLVEAAAQAGLRLVEAESRPSVTLTARYTTDRSLTSLPPPITSFPDSGRTVTMGVSIGLPVFNRNQGAKAEAAVAITQAQQRRVFIEAVIRAEVASAFARQQAANAALATYEQGALTRSQNNIRAIRGAYEVGAFKVTELLAEQRRLLDTQREYIEATAERARALVDLQIAMGVPQDKGEKR